jgi:hypothetical protein
LLGYNHPSLLSAFDSKSAMRALVNRPALGVYPGADWVDRLRSALISAAPPGLDQVLYKVVTFLGTSQDRLFIFYAEGYLIPDPHL